MYRVIKGFFDLQDSNRWYDAGEKYPRDGYHPTEKRIAELSGNKNRQLTALIELVEEPEEKSIKRNKKKD